MDKFYTHKRVAKKLAGIVTDVVANDLMLCTDKEVTYIEPTAGDGSFMDYLPNVVGYDIEPDRDDIIKLDVFDNKFKATDVIVGNPPFGKNSSLAVKIFNHIAKFNVQAICFIVPRTFKKPSLTNRLSMNYTLHKEVELPKDSFYSLKGEKLNADLRCVFQIWVKQPRTKLDTTPKETHIML